MTPGGWGTRLFIKFDQGQIEFFLSKVQLFDEMHFEL